MLDDSNSLKSWLDLDEGREKTNLLENLFATKSELNIEEELVKIQKKLVIEKESEYTLNHSEKLKEVFSNEYLEKLLNEKYQDYIQENLKYKICTFDLEFFITHYDILNNLNFLPKFQNSQNSHIFQDELNSQISHYDFKVFKKKFQILKKLENSVKKGKSFSISQDTNSIFSKLKCHYENKKKKVPALFRRDCIRKKIKSHFMTWIHLQLNKTLQIVFPSIKLKKFNHSAISNITIKLNSELLNKTLFELYPQYFENTNLLKNLKDNLIEQDLVQITLTPLHELYKDYLYSSDYDEDLEEVKKTVLENNGMDEKNPEDRQLLMWYMFIYNNFSENFVEYFRNTQPNTKIIKEEARQNPKKLKNEEIKSIVERSREKN
jgi:hypothetical protein